MPLMELQQRFEDVEGGVILGNGFYSELSKKPMKQSMSKCDINSRPPSEPPKNLTYPLEC